MAGNRRVDGWGVAGVSGTTVNARLLVIILLLLSLALGPAGIATACAAPVKAHCCHSCCPAPGHGCCAGPGKCAPREFPAAVAPQSQDGKQVLFPVLVFMGASLRPAAELVWTQQRQAVPAPGRTRHEVTCIRLI